MKTNPDTFQNCVSKAKDWEKKLENLSRLWRVLNQKQNTIETWLDQAQAVLEDTEDDYESLIRKQKQFFLRVDDRMLKEYLAACKDILVVLDEEDRPALTESMENIQQRWEVSSLSVPARSPDTRLIYLTAQHTSRRGHKHHSIIVSLVCWYFSLSLSCLLTCSLSSFRNLEQSLEPEFI